MNKITILLTGLLLILPTTACTRKNSGGISNGTVQSAGSLPPPVKDGISILTTESYSLAGDSADINISSADVKRYFETARVIPEDMALERLKTYDNLFSVCGKMDDGTDTLNYFILGDGTGITIEYRRLISEKKRKVTFYHNNINLPRDKYKKIKSPLNILHFEKSKFDFALWEIWKERNTDGRYTYDSEEYKAYKRWNEEMDANGICKAFALSELLVGRGALNASMSVDHNCRLAGLAIMNSKLYRMFMDGGGAIYLVLAGDDMDELIYGCYKPECLQYFTGRLETVE